MQASIACVLGPVTSHLNMAIWRPELLICMAEKPQSWNVAMKKSNLQRLKKSKKFAFRNSPFTKQHNISLNGTKSKIFDRVRRSTTQQVNNMKGLSVRCKKCMYMYSN